MISTRQPLRKSAIKSKSAIAERKNRVKKTVNRTVTFTESTIEMVGTVQKENKVEVVFASEPVVVEVASKSKRKKIDEQ